MQCPKCHQDSHNFCRLRSGVAIIADYVELSTGTTESVLEKNIGLENVTGWVCSECQYEVDTLDEL